MKHLITLIALCFAFVGVQAQTAMTASGTLTNTVTGYVTGRAAGGYGNLSVQLILKTSAGTVTGVARLQACNDGIHYVTINPTDTLAISSTDSVSKLWNVGISPYLYYRLKIDATGTHTTVGTGNYLFRPIN